MRKWLPAIAWAVMISVLSTDSFSTARTSHFIIPPLHWLFPQASAETLELMHAVIRKAAHLTEYFIFGLLSLRALRNQDRAWKLRWAVWAIVLAAGYASLDEFHQSFVPSRTASPWDALLDTIGATFAQISVWFWGVFRARSADAKRISVVASRDNSAEEKKARSG